MEFRSLQSRLIRNAMTRPEDTSYHESAAKVLIWLDECTIETETAFRYMKMLDRETSDADDNNLIF